MQLNKGLIVSCQACETEPFYNLNLMRFMAKAAVEGGAVAIRALADEIPQIKQEVSVPIIGLIKRHYLDSDIYITPTTEEAQRVIDSGADAIAIDATQRIRPDGITLDELVTYVRKNAPEVEIVADIDTLESALNAERLGFDYISTTLLGYTEATKNLIPPDYKLIRRLKAELKSAKLIVEGGIWEIGQLKRVLKFNPFAVVVGTAITRPRDITKRFAEVMSDKS